MPMKFSKFPYLIQKEILSQLCLNSIFFFSLCSEKMKNFLIQTQKKEFKSLERIVYELDFYEVKAYFSSGTCSSYLPILGAYGEREEIVNVDVCGKLIRFWRDPQSIASELFVVLSPGEEESIFEAIHNHLYNLFGNNTEFSADVSKPPHFLPKLKNLYKTEVHGSCFKSEKMDEYLFGCPNLQCLYWLSDRDYEMKLSKNSRVFEMDSVEIWGTGPLGTEILKHFNGRQAFLKVEFTQLDIVEFLETWKSGKGFQNLEVMWAEKYYSFHNEEVTVMNRIEFKRLDEEVVYPINKLFKTVTTSLQGIDFSSQFYLVRESDGRVASLKVMNEGGFREPFLVMGVWNMTEKEFLEKFAK